jgi:hypothetical protein
VGRIEDALKRFRGAKRTEAVERADLRGGRGGRGPTRLPSLDLFVSPWQFTPADEAARPAAGTSGGGCEPVTSLVPPAAAPHGPDAGDCQGDGDGGLAKDGWLPGVVSAGCEPKIDYAAFVAPVGSLHVSSMDHVDGSEASLGPECHVASAAIEQPGARQAHEVQLRLAQRIAAGQGAPPALAQAAFEELLAATGAARGRLMVRTPAATETVTFAVVGSWPTTIPLPDLEPLRTEFSPDRIVTTVRLAGGGSAGVEFQPIDHIPFTRDAAFLTEAGLAMLGTWLSGVTSATGGRLAPPVTDVRPTPTLEEAMGGEMERVKRLSLKGGVLVARFTNGGPPRGWTVASVIEAMRKELRSSDLLGQLPTGEVTALLVRASAGGVESVAWRVRERFERLARELRLPPVELGHALYPEGGTESLSALVARARSAASSGSEPAVGDVGGVDHQKVMSES